MKKAKFHEKLTCGLFCGFLAIMCVLYLVLPKDDFSQVEKRNLAYAPQLTWESLLSGQFGTDMETYMADHIPGRNFFVGLGAYFELATGRQPSKDIYLAENDRLVEAPVKWDQAQMEKNMKYINKFSKTVGQDVDLILVPSAGSMLEDTILGLHDQYNDWEYIDRIYAMAEDGIRCMDLTGFFRNLQEADKLYYRTDHHWTSYGAYQAYTAYMQCLGREYPSQDHFRVQTVEGFHGSTYSRSALWLTPAESIQLWSGSDLVVTNSTTGQPHDGPFYPHRLQEADKYTVFLDGNQPMVRISNPANAGKGKLLVIRDSYANCIGPFLAESYEEVVMVDLRYYKMPISQLCQEEEFDNILVLYSIGNFSTDTNFPLLR